VVNKGVGMNLIKSKGWLVSVLVFLLVAIAAQGSLYPLGNGWTMIVNKNIQGTEPPYIYQPPQNDTVTIELEKNFFADSYDGQYYRPIQIEFMKTSADAASKIVINDEYITNATGHEWNGFDMHLMVDALNPQAGFNSGVLPSGDQLEKVSFSENYGFDGLPIQLSFADTDGSGVLSSAVDNDVFQPGYISGSIEIMINPNMAVGSRFGLKEIPVSHTPEPMTLALFGIGTLFLIRKKRK